LAKEVNVKEAEAISKNMSNIKQ
jgi:hypothetical protein